MASHPRGAGQSPTRSGRSGEMAAAADSKSAALKACGFESHLRHPFLGKSPNAFKTVKRVDEYRQGIVCAKNENKSPA